MTLVLFYSFTVLFYNTLLAHKYNAIKVIVKLILGIKLVYI